MTGFIAILISSILVQNFVLSKFLAICSFLGVSKNLKSATGMGVCVIFVACFYVGYLACISSYP